MCVNLVSESITIDCQCLFHVLSHGSVDRNFGGQTLIVSTCRKTKMSKGMLCNCDQTTMPRLNVKKCSTQVLFCLPHERAGFNKHNFVLQDQKKGSFSFLRLPNLQPSILSNLRVRTFLSKATGENRNRPHQLHSACSVQKNLQTNSHLEGCEINHHMFH